MQKIFSTRPQITLMGITARTSNAFETDPAVSQIAPTVQKYFHENLSALIPGRKTPDVTFCAYTDYESDFNGEYTYFIGEEVESSTHIPDGFSIVEISAGDYVKYTNGPGPMPAVCIDIWKEIWASSDDQLGGKRRYQTDFEIYDERAHDHQNVILDVWIGIHSK